MSTHDKFFQVAIRNEIEKRLYIYFLKVNKISVLIYSKHSTI